MKKTKLLAVLLAAAMSMSVVLTGCGGGNAPAEPEKKEEVTQTSTDAEKKEETKDSATDGEEKLAAEQVLRINWGSNPPDLDPQTTTDQVSFEVVNACYEGLVRLQPDGKAYQDTGLAKSWEISEDKMTYKFMLRDAKWTDGTPITAEDFEYAWKRALDPATASQYAYMLYHIKGAQAYNAGEGSADDVAIKALDEKTLEVTLERPTPFFASLTSFITYLPAQKAAIEKHGDKYTSDVANMVFSGPFKITEWVQEQKLTLEKNEMYWDKENVKLDRIEGDMIIDINTPINLYETNELDAIAVQTEYLAKYRTSPEFGNLAIATTWYLQYNCEDPFFSNEKIRHAFSMAVNRKAFVDNVLANGSQVASGLVPGNMPGKSGGGDFRTQSGEFVKDAGTDGQAAIDEANKLLDEGLAEIGKTREELAAHVSYLTGESDVAKKWAQAFQQMWKQNLGLEVPIETVSFKIRLERYNNKDFTLTMAGWGADYNDPMTFMDLFVTGGGQNTAYWSNPEFDALIEKATNTTGDERMQAMIDAEKILLDEQPISPIYFKARNFVQRDYVKGWVRYSVGVDNEWKWTYLTEH
ncbi:MAG: peptide ABC transporter substrate-binding protein [Tissierellales bacterium]|jgi:oligopeptide transport system substrate-binding protein|nr:peptide ABC transporter substrate-binding protein [Tissierellales bacterium]